MVVIKKKELIDLPTGRISKEEAYEILIEGVSKYLNEEDIALIKKAYEIAEKQVKIT